MSRQEPATPVDGLPTVAPPVRRRGPRAGTVAVSLLLAVLLGVGVGALVAQRGGEEPGPAATGEPSAEADTLEPAAVSSFDPVGGTGFRDQGDGTWSTQTYNSADWGGLKEGAGLLLDLGEPAEVTTVTLESATPGLPVALLGADEPPTDSVEGLAQGGTATTGEGATELGGEDAGSHRYWLVWVDELAPRDGGFGAEVSTPLVEGRPG